MDSILKHISDTAEKGDNFLTYQAWLKNNKERVMPNACLRYSPLISVIVYVGSSDPGSLLKTVGSVLDQTYEKYELVLLIDRTAGLINKRLAGKFSDDRHVKTVHADSAEDIPSFFNKGIISCTGEYVSFMQTGDTLSPIALYEIVNKLNDKPEFDIVYSDEDRITGLFGIRHSPWFKPEWAPETFMSKAYIGNLSIFRTRIARELGGFRPNLGKDAYFDFVLRFVEKSSNSKVGHIPEVLYHRTDIKKERFISRQPGSKERQTALQSLGIVTQQKYVRESSGYINVYAVAGEPLVSVIIPSKDNPEMLFKCIDSLITCTGYKKYEIIVVDNGSEQDNKTKISEYLSNINAKYIYEKSSFNFSRMCNKGASKSEGDFLLFMNDDIEHLQTEWLETMLGQAQQKNIGAVGIKLCYPGSTVIQHAGVLNYENGPTHLFYGLDDQDQLYCGLNKLPINCSSVTGACLMVSRCLFENIGGFDEGLPVAYNDVDLCLRLNEAGYYNVVRNDIVSYHHESVSRGLDRENKEKAARLQNDKTVLYSKHPEFKGTDPFLNGNLKRLGKYMEFKTVDPVRFFDRIIHNRAARLLKRIAGGRL